MTIGHHARLMFAALACMAAAPVVSAQTVAIVGGMVYPVIGAPIAHGTVLMRDGKIVAVGADVAIPADAKRVDATGKIVTPGLVDGFTELGVGDLVFLGSFTTPARDISARGTNNIAASFRIWDGLDTESVLFAPARDEGVTTVVMTPEGGLLAGQSAVIDLVQGSAVEMIRRAPAAMHAQVRSPSAAGTSARGELMTKLRRLLDDVKYFQSHRAEYARGATRTLSAPIDDLEALIPVVEGKLPLVVVANQVRDINSALQLAAEYHLKLIIQGGAEAWMIADKLAAAHVPVMTGAMNNIPHDFETLNQRQENAAILSRAGVKVAIIGNSGNGGEEHFNVRNLKYEAGNAVSYGMDHDAALRAVTLTPAELFGVADHVGALTPGRDANVVVWSGDPFELTTMVEHVFVHGRDVHGEKSRQDLLTEKYRSVSGSAGRP